MDDLYVLARRVLLDALEALGAHRDAVTLVGAQAIYLRMGEGDIAVAPTTADADLSIDPALLTDRPAIETLMREAGFERKRSENHGDLTGIWIKAVEGTEVSVDLLIPRGVAPPGGRRAARLRGHEKGSVLKVTGLEAALADADVVSIGALDSQDRRVFDIRVAGPGALLVAKIHKIRDRDVESGRRLSNKDALDVFRLLRGTSTQELTEHLANGLSDIRSREVTREAIGALPELFGDERGLGVSMTVSALESLMLQDEVVQSVIALTTDLVTSIRKIL